MTCLRAYRVRFDPPDPNGPYAGGCDVLYAVDEEVACHAYLRRRFGLKPILSARIRREHIAERNVSAVEVFAFEYVLGAGRWCAYATDPHECREIARRLLGCEPDEIGETDHLAVLETMTEAALCRMCYFVWGKPLPRDKVRGRPRRPKVCRLSRHMPFVASRYWWGSGKHIAHMASGTRKATEYGLRLAMELPWLGGTDTSWIDSR